MKGRGLVICDSNNNTTSGVFYHLREVPEDGPQLVACFGKALCGQDIEWDTNIRLGAWGVAEFLKGRWCDDCFDKAKSLLDDIDPVDRVSGLVVCETCKREYRLHRDAYFDYSGQPFLTRLCDGRIVKL